MTGQNPHIGGESRSLIMTSSMHTDQDCTEDQPVDYIGNMSTVHFDLKPPAKRAERDSHRLDH
ncbi:hypothetical protein [Bifidobacterium asteroides]|uniref:Uncharacterized protein n=1 Tax=Bifidobacterium asteroides TaxID=1684 RepID=A0A318M6J7_9BIFI|nr:hypothetical protein [Bifidobacterium asteroides]PXY82610.1 hypothetical protein DKK75_02430 [Bifidobacterium asteroides]